MCYSACLRVKVMIQFVSHVSPPSAENACSQRAELAVISETDIDWLARALVSLPFAFRVRAPPELRDALLRLQARIAHAITI